MADFPVESLPTGRPRPALFRALGANDPPPTITVGGRTYCRVEIFKHDSWAATAIYESPSRKALWKFNRQQAIFIIPMRWLGRLLAARERGFHDRLAGIAGIAPTLGAVCVDGKPLPHAVARTFIDGHALAEGEWVDDKFFPRFQALLTNRVRTVMEKFGQSQKRVDFNEENARAMVAAEQAMARSALPR